MKIKSSCQEYWNELTKQSIKKARSRKIRENRAKSHILFLGDGMGFPTTTAGRILIKVTKSSENYHGIYSILFI